MWPVLFRILFVLATYQFILLHSCWQNTQLLIISSSLIPTRVSPWMAAHIDRHRHVSVWRTGVWTDEQLASKPCHIVPLLRWAYLPSASTAYCHKVVISPPSTETCKACCPFYTCIISSTACILIRYTPCFITKVRQRDASVNAE